MYKIEDSQISYEINANLKRKDNKVINRAIIAIDQKVLDPENKEKAARALLAYEDLLDKFEDLATVYIDGEVIAFEELTDDECMSIAEDFLIKSKQDQTGTQK